MLEEHPKAPHSSGDLNPGRRMHQQAVDLVEALNQMEDERLENWKWQSFVGEENALEALYQEAPDTPSKRCLVKVSQRGAHAAGRGWMIGIRALLQSDSLRCSPVCACPAAGHQAGDQDAGDERQGRAAARRRGAARALGVCQLAQEPHAGESS